MTVKSKAKVVKQSPIQHEISSLNQWKRAYLPEFSANERLDDIFCDGSHVGALLAARVLSTAHGNNKARSQS